MAERVSLTDRPGTFFVVSRALGRVQLLDEREREFSVPAERVKKATKLIRTAAKEPVKPSVEAVDFSRYAEFTSWLVENRERIYFKVSVHPDRVADLCAKYLDLTGENLFPDQFATNPDTPDWKCIGASFSFPRLPRNFLVPGKLSDCSLRLRDYQRVSNLEFFWYLVEHHSFRLRKHEG